MATRKCRYVRIERGKKLAGRLEKRKSSGVEDLEGRHLGTKVRYYRELGGNRK